jgi:dTDP-4-dehydrorhamnose 3,5-epimerase
VRVEPTDIEGVALLHWELIADERGAFARTFCEVELAGAGLPFRAVQSNISRNTARHTLRGMHYQRAPHGEPKIISCTRGRIWDVAVDMRPGSATYRRWIAVELAPDQNLALHLPIGIAHGFITLEPDSEVHYLMGAEYVAAAAHGIRWDDPAIAIGWPAQPKVISARDAGYPLIELSNNG